MFEEKLSRGGATAQRRSKANPRLSVGFSLRRCAAA
jgi:hypothetical protein